MNFIRRLTGLSSTLRSTAVFSRGGYISTNAVPQRNQPSTTFHAVSPVTLKSLGASLGYIGNSCSLPPLLNSASSSSDGLVLQWIDGTKSLVHFGWLFRVCPCPRCKQPHSGQSLLDPQQMPTNPKPISFSVAPNGQELSVHWGESHVSTLSASFLRDNAYDDQQLQRRLAATNTSALTRDTGVPVVPFERFMSDDKGLWEVLSSISDFGAVIVDEAPAEVGIVSGAAERIAPVMQTIYGRTWHVKAEDRPINIAFSNVSLSLHQDLAYYESPPGLQFLHCVRFDSGVQGGDSVLLDLKAAAEELRTTNPEAFHTLTLLPATFQKIHYDRETPVHIVYRRPHISVNSYGDVTAAFWAPAFEGTPMLPASQMRAYFDAYKAFADIIEDPHSPHRVGFKLRPGQIFIFNNRRMVHGRTAFTLAPGSVRHLQGCYISAEDYSSALQIMGSKFPSSQSQFRSLMFGSHL